MRHAVKVITFVEKAAGDALTRPGRRSHLRQIGEVDLCQRLAFGKRKLPDLLDAAAGHPRDLLIFLKGIISDDRCLVDHDVPGGPISHKVVVNVRASPAGDIPDLADEARRESELPGAAGLGPDGIGHGSEIAVELSGINEFVNCHQ